MNKRIRGLKPTLKQTEILRKNSMTPDDWLIKKVFSDRLECIHRFSGNTKTAFCSVAK